MESKVKKKYYRHGDFHNKKFIDFILKDFRIRKSKVKDIEYPYLIRKTSKYKL